MLILKKENKMELIKIENKEGKKTVDARELYYFLESKQEFSKWVKDRIDKYDFVQGVDFIKFDKLVNSGSKPRTEYHLSMDMAKELSMVERNDKGKEARRYFIDCEKKMKGEVVSLSPAELLLQQAQQLVAQEKRLSEIDNRINLIEAKQKTTQNDYFTISGYCSLKGIKVTATMANAYGRKCSKFSKEFDYKIDKVLDPRFGQVNSYHLDVLSENIP